LQNDLKNGSSIITVFPLVEDGKKAKYFLLAPIAVEILLCRGSAQKIETDSGIMFPKKAKYFCSKFFA
jgi:hypothetical protein